MTVQQLLIDALGLIGTVEIDETPTASELQNALRAANVMLDSWSSQRLMLRSATKITFPITQGKATYTLGSVGADITANKIVSIHNAYVTDNSIDYPLEVVSEEVYDNFQDKNVSTGRPEYISYNPGSAQQVNQTGSISFYYTPDKSYTVSIEAEVYLNEFVNLSDNVTFEPAYYEAIIYNLAVRLFRRYHSVSVQIPVDILQVAHDSKNSIMSMNAVQVTAGMELPGKTSKYNIYTDQG